MVQSSLESEEAVTAPGCGDGDSQRTPASRALSPTLTMLSTSVLFLVFFTKT
jgi:hypothetical protein